MEKASKLGLAASKTAQQEQKKSISDLFKR